MLRKKIVFEPINGTY